MSALRIFENNTHKQLEEYIEGDSSAPNILGYWCFSIFFGVDRDRNKIYHVSGVCSWPIAANIFSNIYDALTC